jgi:urate oxidase
MKTARCAFAGFPRDEYTTLHETEDRIVATRLTATWRYGSPPDDFDAAWHGVVDSLLEVFAEHDSASVQASCWQMGTAVLDRVPAVDEIRMSLPNLHHWLVDLSPFGLANENEIFVATAEPYGLIEATVRRGDESGR